MVEIINSQGFQRAAAAFFRNFGALLLGKGCGPRFPALSAQRLSRLILPMIGGGRIFRFAGQHLCDVDRVGNKIGGALLASRSPGHG